MTHALIDADLIAYRCAATCEEFDEPTTAIDRCFYQVEAILHSTQADGYTLYLTGSGNFRYKINPEYKAHRKDKPKPKWLQQCREALVATWQAKVTEGIEADDALGINQNESTIICSLDKDLLMIPGRHFNWVKEEITEVTPFSGLRHFWKQTIIGDTADNIQGVRGLGVKKAERIIDPIEADSTEELDKKCYEVVKGLYGDIDRLHMNAKCLWILREEDGVWQAPEETQLTESTEVALSESSPAC